jgi:ankyrin repeat protein
MRGFYAVLIVSLIAIIAINGYHRYRKAQQRRFESEIFHMARKGDTEGLRRELDNGRDVNSRYGYDGKGPSLLEISIQYNNTDCARLLLERGAKLYTNPNLLPPLLLSALDRASGAPNQHGPAHHTPGVEIVRMLLDRGAPIDGSDKGGTTTPLFWAAVYNHTEIMLELIKRGARVNRKTIGAMTALGGAVSNGSTEAVQILIAYGANVNERCVSLPRSTHLVTPLQAAIKEHHPEIVRLLIQAGAKK